MATDQAPTIIKKYANRRLYHTGTSTYVTLEDLARMVRQGEDFQVFDAKSGEDLTRSVLTQIIFEQESKEGQSLLPVAFLRQLIRFYGDSLQAVVPRYLEFSIENLAQEHQKLREQMAQAFRGPTAFQAIEEQVRANMGFFTDAMRLFSPFSRARKDGEGTAQGGATAEPASSGVESAAAQPPGRGELDDLKAQMADMQAKLELLARK